MVFILGSMDPQGPTGKINISFHKGTHQKDSRVKFDYRKLRSKNKKVKTTILKKNLQKTPYKPFKIDKTTALEKLV